MTEKTEWEVLDASPHGERHAGRTLQDQLKSLLGRYWGWKLLGAGLATSMAVIFFVAVTGVFLLGTLALGAVALLARNIVRWLGGQESTAIAPRERQ